MSASPSLQLWSYYGLTSQVWLYRLLLGMKTHTPHLLLRREWLAGRTFDEFPWPAAQLHLFPERTPLSKAIGRMGALLKTGRWDVLSQADARHIRELCRRIQANVIHVHMGWLACSVLGGSPGLGAKPFASLYGSDVFRTTNGPRYFSRLSRLLRQDLPIHVTSQHLKDGVVALGGSPDHVHVVPVGIWLPDLPTEEKTVRHRESRQSVRRIRLITVGRLVEYKAPQRLPEVARILKDRGLDFEWNLVGEGPLMPEVGQNAQKLGVSDRFFVKGRLPFDTVADLRWNSDIMVHNAVIAPDGSRECLGVTLLEAQAVGIPVVSCKVGGIPEAVADGSTGLLVESGDLEGMADRIMRLSNDSELRHRMGQAAVRHARDNFDSRKLGERIESIYDSLPGRA